MLNQIIFEMKHQKMMTWVSISGTALAIFLVMIFFMIDNLPTIEAPPENNRSRMLYGGQFEIRRINGHTINGGMTLKTAEKIFSDLDGIEKTAHSGIFTEVCLVGTPLETYRLDALKTDADFWRMYDFKFINGKPYTQASFESGEKVVVITRSVARKLFNKDSVAGEQLYINCIPYKIEGVIDDIPPSMKASYSMIYIPFSENEIEDNGYVGEVMVHLLRKPGVEEEDIKKQVETRFERINSELSKDSLEAVYRGSPFNVEFLGKASVIGNFTPDLSKVHRESYITYLILLLLPAINLSSMTRSRLRHRVSEIGVRRAFGAKKTSIILQLLGENFIITLIGGVIGSILSLITVYFGADYLFNITELNGVALQLVSSSPPISMLFNWHNFLTAFAACFVLNLMSGFSPAWRASRVAPAVAILKSFNN